jgi:hypothetical protein
VGAVGLEMQEGRVERAQPVMIGHAAIVTFLGAIDKLVII